MRISEKWGPSNFLLLKPVLEEHDHRTLFAVDFSVVDQCNHGGWVHRLTLIELEIAKLAKKALHHTVDILLESVHLSCSVVVLQILHNLLHVVLEVGHVVVLLGKTSLNQPVVENQVDTGLGGLLGALLHLLGGGVAALVLAVHLVNAV